jgi:hypothetical protein
MKAEHRKELQTNELADRLGRLLQSVKSGSSSTSFYLWVVIILLVVAAILAWRSYSEWIFASRSTLWLKVSSAAEVEDLQDLDKLANDHRGTPPARAARFQMARLKLNQGLESLFSENRSTAIERIQEARDLYEALAAESTGTPLLAQEALMGLAKAEEALVGVPKGNNPKESRGSLEQALEWYTKLAEKYPDSFLGKAAAERAQMLEGNHQQVQDFYLRLNQLALEAGKSPSPETATDPPKGPQ